MNKQVKKRSAQHCGNVNFDRFDLTSLRIFLAVYQERSMSRAAERERIAASAISKRLHEMEHLLGAAMFIRVPGGVKPTSAGHALARHVESISQLFQKIRSDMSRFAEGVVGDVYVCSNTMGTLAYASRAAMGFSKIHPDASITIDEKPSVGVVRELVDGIADIGIVNSAARQANLIRIHTIKTRLFVVMNKGHVLETKPSIAFADTLPFPHIALHESDYLMHLISPVLEVPRTHNVSLRPSSYSAIIGLVELGAGIAIMPEMTCVPLEKAHSIVCRPLTDNWAEFGIDICIRDEKTLSGTAKQFLQYLVEMVQG